MNMLGRQGKQHRPIVVVGSLNMDLVMHTARVPVAGETLSGSDFQSCPGGKGANQAVACARMGSSVRMIGRVGIDAFGKTLRNTLISDNIDISLVKPTSDASTGVAMILVEESGQNRIVLAPGANAALSPEDIDEVAPIIGQAAMLILQLEIPMPAVLRAISIARAASVPILLNPAPATTLPDEVWNQVDILVPNETEASLLADFSVTNALTAMQAARKFRERGIAKVMITLGSQGVVVADNDGEHYLPARVVRAIDTTAAGDTFIGAAATALTEGMTLIESAVVGQYASSLCVTRSGAQTSIPFRYEVNFETA